jgi:hypothetical protein
MTNPSVTTDRVLSEVLAERIAQDTKWGEQNHPDVETRDIPLVTHHYYASRADIWKQVNEERATPSRGGRCFTCPAGEGVPHGHTAWDGVLLEEVYEALAEDDPAKLRTELLQVAAVAVAWIEAIDRRTANAAEQPRVCGRCRKPFDPTDTRWDGHAEKGTTGFCRSCVDRCHESTDAFHVCPICR